MQNLNTTAELPAPTWPRNPRSLESGRGVSWWSEGWRVFMASPALWIGIVVVALIIFIVLTFVPIVGSIVQSLIWPAIGGGILVGCHALARGQPLVFSHLFAGFSEGRAAPLLILGLIGMLAGLAFGFVVLSFLAGSMGISGIAGMMTGDPYTAWQGALAGMSAAALIIVPLAIIAFVLMLMAFWFATPLIALNRADALTAIKASFDASRKNIGALLLFVLIAIPLAIVASIPFGLGWLVLWPVMAGGWYASWREVFGE
ncbi:MAG TPA: BPSS1780 family membrane protein [Casimicrobiaceae bacterium]|nr:BPSS1780 family membrane protein [Casimicrobiaceae bacterium]